jgi:hypothetical protein
MITRREAGWCKPEVIDEINLVKAVQKYTSNVGFNVDS